MFAVTTRGNNPNEPAARAHKSAGRPGPAGGFDNSALAENKWRTARPRIMWMLIFLAREWVDGGLWGDGRLWGDEGRVGHRLPLTERKAKAETVISTNGTFTRCKQVDHSVTTTDSASVCRDYLPSVHKASAASRSTAWKHKFLDLRGSASHRTPAAAAPSILYYALTFSFSAVVNFKLDQTMELS
ncbi:hypothetical protein EVAR_98560_1 [Eumeta japonica]|uniref:Uncharacterized protein n=1 Tax=Eumeta variegata TaxID=151549 RepID=A0A4C1YKW4_EUMVA|nr:hypothetical protein EVAR_98560_1 [Eumeta japonica]